MKNKTKNNQKSKQNFNKKFQKSETKIKTKNIKNLSKNLTKNEPETLRKPSGNPSRTFPDSPISFPTHSQIVPLGLFRTVSRARIQALKPFLIPR